MTEHIMETASVPETAKTEEKKNGITEEKKKIPHSHPHYSTEWKEFGNGKASGFTTEITLTGIFRLIYNSNPFYLISASPPIRCCWRRPLSSSSSGDTSGTMPAPFS